MRSKTRTTSSRLVSLLFLALCLLIIFALTLRPFVKASASPAVVFSNSSPIQINTTPPPPTPATPYPSNINVSGMSGTTTKITVTLNNITHQRPSDIDVLLVSPSGTNFVIMSDAITLPVTNLTLTLDSTAANNLSSFVSFSSNTSVTFRPADYPETETFPAPAPAPPYNRPFQNGSASLSVFNGADPNGTWSLYVVDDTIGSVGNIAGGWTLNVTTTGTAATNFSNSTTITNNDTPTAALAASPYPSSINVSGLSGVVTGLTVTLNGISHARTEDIDILLVNPNGVGTILMSDAAAGASSNATVTFDDAAANFVPGAGPLTNGTYKPTNIQGNDNSTGGDLFAPPAPQALPAQQQFPAYNNTLAALKGYSPNGTWSLYVMDDQEGNTGQIAGGWSLDITTAPYTPPIISCLVPTFSSSSDFAANSTPTGIAKGDFNNDMKTDLVLANQGSNNVSVLLGNGMGGFASPSDFPTGTSPYAVAVGLFNADANQDLVVVNSGSNNVSILLGNGTGGFSAPTNFGVGISPISVVVGDFNNDSKADLAVANFGGFFAGTVSVLLGTGTGTFNPAVNFGVRTQPASLVIGDFNNDMKHDLAVVNFGSNNVSILLGTGTGSFTAAASNVNVGTGPASIATGDFNNDGQADLAVANYNSDNISILLGIGGGTFTNTGNINSGTNPISIIASDLNGDGKADLSVASSSSNNIRVLFGGGDGSFGLGAGQGTFSTGAGPNSLISADFNGDGDTDLATANSSANSTTVLLSQCVVAQGNRFDFESDRRTDLTVFRPSTGFWYILPSTTGSGLIFKQLGTNGDTIVPEDYNGDGITDIGVYRAGTWIIGPNIYNLPYGLSTDTPVPADYDGDLRADLAVWRPSDGNWFVRKTTDHSQMIVQFGMSGDRAVPRDYDGDGKADIAVFRPSNGVWYILRSSDSQVAITQWGMSGDRAVPADYDGDGKADLAVFRPSQGNWYILRSSDSGVAGFSWGLSTDIPAPGDFDGDGKFDLAVWRPSNGYWFVLRSSNNALQAVQFGMNGDVPASSAYVALP